MAAEVDPGKPRRRVFAFAGRPQRTARLSPCRTARPVGRETAHAAAHNKITAKKDIVIHPDFAREPLPGEIDPTFNFMGRL